MYYHIVPHFTTTFILHASDETCNKNTGVDGVKLICRLAGIMVMVLRPFESKVQNHFRRVVMWCAGTSFL